MYLKHFLCSFQNLMDSQIIALSFGIKCFSLKRYFHSILQDTCTLELQHSFGQSFKTLAVCQLRFHDLFDHPPGRIHCTASLTGTFSSFEMEKYQNIINVFYS